MIVLGLFRLITQPPPVYPKGGRELTSCYKTAATAFNREVWTYATALYPPNKAKILDKLIFHGPFKGRLECIGGRPPAAQDLQV